MKKNIDLAVVGVGSRGTWLIENVLTKLNDVKIVAVCDNYSDRAEKTVEKINGLVGYKPLFFKDYKTAIKVKNLDAVLVSTSWEDHIKIAIEAMENHIAVAMEVGCAYSLDELYQLIEAKERTKTKFMFMENCCFDKHESMAMMMARDNFFGEIVHMCGSYSHDLRNEIAGGEINHHYRLRNYLNRNCENYPTHEIGPIAKILNINAGNRFKSLVSIASKSKGMETYIWDHKKDFPDLVGQKFAQADVVNTIITCENGETIEIKLDTTLPRSYDRNFAVQGTKASYEGSTHSVFKDGDEEQFDTTEYYASHIKNGTKYEEQYLPTWWKATTPEILAAGHGGMDYFEFRYFFNCLKNNEEPLLTVYDAASWMAISVLSEKSIKEGGSIQYFPDFTNGKWKTNKVKDLVDVKIN